MRFQKDVKYYERNKIRLFKDKKVIVFSSGIYVNIYAKRVYWNYVIVESKSLQVRSKTLIYYTSKTSSSKFRFFLYRIKRYDKKI